MVESAEHMLGDVETIDARVAVKESRVNFQKRR
jgi:hypothetical protein